MDDDLVADLLSNRDSLIVVLQEHLQLYYAKDSSSPPLYPCECQNKVSRPPVFISKKEHGTDSLQAKQPLKLNKRIYPAELLYADIKTTQNKSITNITDKSIGKSISKSSKNSSSRTSNASRSSEETTSSGSSSGSSSSSNSSDETAACKICDGKLYPDTEHICFDQTSGSSNESPEAMPLDRLSVSDSFKERIQKLTIPEILWLDDASPKDARPGHIIAYKALEIASNVTPVVSNYRIAEIVETHENGSLSVQILREFRHGKETSSDVDSSVKQRRANLLNSSNSSAEPGLTDSALVVLDPALIYNLKFLR
ncbi:hypothetical protein EV178_002383 [Coemansia sp. RSA 1646]|nr:hypothetical protein EV178_002383 [Coemansia sp. RSA 1646]